MPEIKSLTAADLLRLYRKRELSPVEVTRDQLDRIDKFEPAINAFIIVDRDGALKAAQASEARWQKGEPIGPADGLGATVKDNIWLKGFPSRRGSLTSSDAPMKEDAPAVARLRESGAVILGKTTLPEFGWIGACHSPLTGITRNPWKLDRTPGGSSGGAAAAALLNLGHLHIGTDGAGSIRIPAAFTGVFGIKPSFGRVAAYPASPFSILAHVGPLTRSVTDAALMLSVIGGPDERDMTAWNTPTPDYRVGLDDGVRGLRVAWSPRLGYVQENPPRGRSCDEKGRAGVRRAWRDRRGSRSRFSRSIRDDHDAVGRGLGHARQRGAAKRSRQNGPRASSRSPNGDRSIRSPIISRRSRRAPISPTRWRASTRNTTCCSPRRCRSRRSRPAASRRPTAATASNWINWSSYTYPFNLTQQPAASVPCGFSSDGLPIGLQIVGPARQDASGAARRPRVRKRAGRSALDAPRQN